MRKLLVAMALLFSAPAFALTYSTTDVTDLWWNPDESGWGVNVIQEGPVVFATFFVYDANGRAHWYVASDMPVKDITSTSITFGGDLFESHGPYFGGPFDPAAVTRNMVGTANLFVTFAGTGRLTYTVNGVTVVKSIVRQTWAVNDSSGAYEGARQIVSGSSSTGCNIGSSSFSNVQIAQSSNTFAMTGNLAGSTCRFNGDYSQQGHMGASTGSFSCDNGVQGTYALADIETTLYGFFARYSGTERGCTVQGRIGGVRTTIKRPPAE